VEDQPRSVTGQQLAVDTSIAVRRSRRVVDLGERLVMVTVRS
jgi:hypothetical protein